MTTRSIRRIGEPPGTPRNADDRIEQDREAAIARGRADLAAGRVVSQEDMLRWLRSWGTDQELPPPVSLEDD